MVTQEATFVDPGALPGWLGNGWLVMELRRIKWLFDNCLMRRCVMESKIQKRRVQETCMNSYWLQYVDRGKFEVLYGTVYTYMYSVFLNLHHTHMYGIHINRCYETYPPYHHLHEGICCQRLFQSLSKVETAWENAASRTVLGKWTDQGPGNSVWKIGRGAKHQQWIRSTWWRWSSTITTTTTSTSSIINNNIIIHHHEFMDSMLVVFLHNDFYNIITFIVLWFNWFIRSLYLGGNPIEIPGWSLTSSWWPKTSSTFWLPNVWCVGCGPRRWTLPQPSMLGWHP